MISRNKKTIFATGLFPGLNKIFLHYLCKNFRVIMLGDQRFETESEFCPEIVEDILDSQALQSNDREFVWKLWECMKFTESQLEQLLPNGHKYQLGKDEYEQLFNATARANLKAHMFRKLNERIKIDMVVSNADYSVYRRPMVLEAKRLGIPTLDIEHGFFATTLEPSALVDRAKMPSLIFFSDFVNLDNEIEKEIWEKYYKLAGVDKHVQFLTLGTPNDQTFERDTSKDEAIEFLGLESGRFTVTVASTWIEARNPAAAISGQLEHVEFFKKTFKTLQSLKQDLPLQVVVKLHPAFSAKQTLRETRSYLERYAKSINLKVSLITCNHISRVLAASDLIVCPHMSSILWECFLADTPGIIFPIPSFYAGTYRLDKLNESNIMCRRGLLKFVTSRPELAETVRYYSEKENQEKFKQAAARLRADKNIFFESAAEKSLRICNWIETFLEGGAKPKVVHEVAKIEGERVKLLFQMANDLLKKGNLIEGLDVLQQVLKLDPLHAGAATLVKELQQMTLEKTKSHRR